MNTQTKQKAKARHVPLPLANISYGDSISIPAKAWKRFQVLQSKQAAIVREIKELRVEQAIDSQTILAHYGKAAREVVICDENWQAIGKATVFRKDSFVMPMTWQVRLS
jgi:hypothetical protein